MYYLVKLYPNQDPETLLSHKSASVLNEIAQIHYATMDPHNRFYMYLCEGEKDINGWYDYHRYIPVRGVEEMKIECVSKKHVLLSIESLMNEYRYLQHDCECIYDTLATRYNVDPRMKERLLKFNRNEAEVAIEVLKRLDYQISNDLPVIIHQKEE